MQCEGTTALAWESQGNLHKEEILELDDERRVGACVSKERYSSLREQHAHRHNESMRGKKVT